MWDRDLYLPVPWHYINPVPSPFPTFLSGPAINVYCVEPKRDREFNKWLTKPFCTFPDELMNELYSDLCEYSGPIQVAVWSARHNIGPVPGSHEFWRSRYCSTILIFPGIADHCPWKCHVTRHRNPRPKTKKKATPGGKKKHKEPTTGKEYNSCSEHI